MLPHVFIICCFIAITYCANVAFGNHNGGPRAKRDVNVTTVDEVSQHLETERRNLVKVKLGIVSEKLNGNNKSEQDWKAYEQKWNEHGKKWEALGARHNAERSLHGNRNKRDESGLIGNPIWDAIRSNTHGQEWREFGKNWDVNNARQDVEQFLHGRKKRDERTHIGNPVWDAIRQNWKQYGDEWREYGKKWEVNDIRRNAERSLHGNRNKRDEGPIGNPIWDAIRRNANGEYGKRWQVNDYNREAERSIHGNRNKRDESKQTRDSKWDATEQKWNAHGQEWKEYGQEWEETGKKSGYHLKL